MKTALISLFLVALGFVSTAFAGTESFRQTCRVRYEDQYRIVADCLDWNNRYVYNDYRRNGICWGDLANIGGRLTCRGGQGGGHHPGPQPGYGSLPQGSYLRTCGNCYTQGYRLTCSCRTSTNYWLQTSLNFRGCRGDIANNEGRLQCYK